MVLERAVALADGVEVVVVEAVGAVEAVPEEEEVVEEVASEAAEIPATLGQIRGLEVQLEVVKVDLPGSPMDLGAEEVSYCFIM